MPAKTINIIPMGAVRQTRSDRWKKRPCVMRYRAFRDELRAKLGAFAFPESGWHMTFYLPPPPSWSAKKRATMEGQPHKARPDIDNLEKAVLDALFDSDSHVWDGRVTKRWSSRPRIEINTP